MDGFSNVFSSSVEVHLVNKKTNGTSKEVDPLLSFVCLPQMDFKFRDSTLDNLINKRDEEDYDAEEDGLSEDQRIIARLRSEISLYNLERSEQLSCALYELSLTIYGNLSSDSGYAPANRGLGQNVRERGKSLNNVHPHVFLKMFRYLTNLADRTQPDILRDYTKSNSSATRNGEYKVVFETAEALSNALGTCAVVRVYGVRSDHDDDDDEECEEKKRTTSEKRQVPYTLSCNLPVYHNLIAFGPAETDEVLMYVSNPKFLEVGDKVHCLRSVHDYTRHKLYDYGVVSKVQEQPEGCKKSTLRRVDVQFEHPDALWCNEGEGERGKQKSKRLKKWEKDNVRVTKKRDVNSNTISERKVYPTTVDAKEIIHTNALWHKTNEAAKSIDSPYGAMVLPSPDIVTLNVFALKLEKIQDTWYYLAIVPNATGKKHLLVTFPPNTAAPRHEVKFPVHIKGDVGYIPARYTGLLEPFKLPAIHYSHLPSRTNNVRFNSRVTVTNVDRHILGGGGRMVLTEDEGERLRKMFPNDGIY